MKCMPMPPKQAWILFGQGIPESWHPERGPEGSWVPGRCDSSPLGGGMWLEEARTRAPGTVLPRVGWLARGRPWSAVR